MTPYYDSGGITIYHGDNRDILPSLPAASVDMVFTSPPYNLGNTTGGGVPAEGSPHGHYAASAPLGSKRGGAVKWSGGALVDGYGACKDSMPHEDYVAWQKETVAACWRLLTDAGAIFYNHKPRVMNGVLVTPFEYLPDLPVRQVIIWARAGGVNFSQAFYVPTHEWVVVVAKPAFRLRDKAASGAGDVWSIAQESNPLHPAPFPVALPSRAIETTTARTILDPFSGVGSTLRAAKNHGRKAIGIEIEEVFCERAAKRMEQEVFAFAD